MTTTTTHFDVLIVGAGISGIGAAYHLKTYRPGTTFAVLEGRESIGGTWSLFRYPGIRSDSDMPSFGYGFKPWIHRKAIADGHIIMDYLRQTVTENRLEEHIRFGYRVLGAQFSSPEGLWTVTARHSGSDETVQFSARFLFLGTGYYDYDAGFTPEFQGVEDFGGQLIHPQHWPEDLDYTGKRVVVIGSGATAVTLIPSMAGKAAHITMLQRSPSYVFSIPAEDAIANVLNKVVGPGAPTGSPGARTSCSTAASTRPASAPQVDAQAADRQRAPATAQGLRRRHPLHTALQPVGSAAVHGARRRPVQGDLGRAGFGGHRPDRAVHRDRHPAGIGSGVGRRHHRHRDRPQHAAVRKDPARRRRSAVNLPDTTVYKSMMLSGVPNLVFALGYTNISWTLKVDLVCEHFCRLLDHMDAHGYHTVEPVLRDPHMQRVPLLDMSSGYVQRAIAKFPRGGTSGPWTVQMAYEKDVERLRRGPVTDPALEFSVHQAARLAS
ncbi:thi4 family protein [Mycobacterium kansasii]|uniref:Thi4 family protein n=1 Tax=Mycobacterium kansasii TaxID=1768 RepID=A0A1V3XSB1_MYCKA|nr:thi4 family protein [Mycobacterium kansasii]